MQLKLNHLNTSQALLAMLLIGPDFHSRTLHMNPAYRQARELQLLINVLLSYMGVFLNLMQNLVFMPLKYDNEQNE